jgi:hypothetical protein
MSRLGIEGTGIEGTKITPSRNLTGKEVSDVEVFESGGEAS